MGNRWVDQDKKVGHSHHLSVNSIGGTGVVGYWGRQSLIKTTTLPVSSVSVTLDPDPDVPVRVGLGRPVVNENVGRLENIYVSYFCRQYWRRAPGFTHPKESRKMGPGTGRGERRSVLGT